MFYIDVFENKNYVDTVELDSQKECAEYLEKKGFLPLYVAELPYNNSQPMGKKLVIYTKGDHAFMYEESENK